VAFTLAQAGDGHVALNDSPVLRERFRRSLVMGMAATGALRTVLFGAAAAVAVAVLVAGWPESLEHGTRLVIGTTVPMLCLGLAIQVGDGFAELAVRAVGSCRRAGPQSLRPVAPPEQVRSADRCVYLCSLALGLPLGALIGLVVGRPPLLPAVGIVVLTALVAAPAGRWGLTDARRIRSGLSAAQDATAALAGLREYGEEATATVTEVHPGERGLGALSVFGVRCTVDGPPAAGAWAGAVEFDFLEYPRWAPVPGSRFRLWIDPSDPGDPTRVLIERRYSAGPVTAGPTTAGRADADGAQEPPWARLLDGLPPRTALIHQLGSVVAVTAVLASLVLAGVWVAQFGWRPGWMLTALAVVLITTSACAWWWLRAGLAPRLVIAETAAPWWRWPAVIVGALACVAVLFFGLAWADDVAAPDAALSYFGSLSLALLVPIAIAAAGYVLVRFDEVPVYAALARNPKHLPAEEIREALTSADPGALDRLERRHGFRTGPRHLLD